MLKSLLAHLFRGRSARQLDRTLESLDAQARAASWDYQGHVYTRAGDLCAEANDRSRAVVFYGRAVDAYLEIGYYDVAATLCRKIIDGNPDVVRARFTLAFLSIAKDVPFLPFSDLLTDARREIGDYVRAAIAAQQEGLASVRLQQMADATDSPELRELIGEHLLELGDSARADAVLGNLYAERNELRPGAEEDQRERWLRELRTAVVHRIVPHGAS